jgi:preprotein translocase subunit SecA
MSNYACKLPLLNGHRYEKPLVDRNWLDVSLLRLKELFRKSKSLLLNENQRMVNAILARSIELENRQVEELNQALHAITLRLRLEGVNNATIIESFAVIREVSYASLGMRHHHTQIRASLALLRGSIAEMATGEGKTLAATLAAATAAMAGIPVHVVTVNDYLAERDAEEMIPLYHALGLTVGIITHDKQLAERREAYACDICYCCNKELTFDFLKDRLVLDGKEKPRNLQASMLTEDASLPERLLLRGLHLAIVDEADSVFIDEARTPLIISGEEKFGDREKALIETAMTLAEKFERDLHFIQDETGAIKVKEAGYIFLGKLCEPLEGLWKSPFYREPLIAQALSALHIYFLDRDYIIDDEGAIQIVDPYTGRVMPGRSWGQGLQQMIELKEGLEITKPRETNAEISYQNFFRKYNHLCGMTGTGKEVAGELCKTYGLRSEVIPLLKKSRRKKQYSEVYPNQDDKWQRVAEVTRSLVKNRQAVLIGTNSVEASELASEFLAREGIIHKVLNAKQDKEEADIVTEAGKPGAVTVSTSMAGRGTDIKLTDISREAGGLHVIITELQDAGRIDRQLAGRSARQGDPGFVSEILSLEDPLVIKMAGPAVRRLIAYLRKASIQISHKLGYTIVKRCQKKIEKAHYKQRMQLIKMDFQRQKNLSFTGERK